MQINKSQNYIVYVYQSNFRHLTFKPFSGMYYIGKLGSCFKIKFKIKFLNSKGLTKKYSNLQDNVKNLLSKQDHINVWISQITNFRYVFEFYLKVKDIKYSLLC